MRGVIGLLLPVVLLGGELRIGVDPRIELFSILFRLAGNPEYTQGRVPIYNEAIDKHFASFRDHEAVRLARSLRQSDGVSYDAVMSMAIHVSDIDGLRERVPFDAAGIELDKRWHGAKARPFLAAVRRFVEDTQFAAFFKQNEQLYRQSEARLRTMVQDQGDIGWFAKFFGVAADSDFVVVPGMANGGGSYGPAFRPAQGTKELYAIIGAGNVDGSGEPVFSGDLPTLVHEFIHSYANPLIDARMKDLAKFGDVLFRHTESEMRPQAYASGQTLLRESLVRAATVRYILEHSGTEAASADTERQRNRGFVWTPQVVAALERYAAKRDRYPTMEQFMPEVVQVFREAAANIGPMLKAYDAERPKVLSVSIANGATDVDAATSELVIRFDRPMRKTSYALARTSKVESPKFGKPAYDDSGTVLRVPITLEPGKDYAFSLNWPMGGSFASESGVMLKHMEVKFRTRN